MLPLNSKCKSGCISPWRIALVLMVVALTGCSWVSRRWHGDPPEQPSAENAPAASTTLPLQSAPPSPQAAPTQAAVAPSIAERAAQQPSSGAASPAPAQRSAAPRAVQRKSDAAIDLGCVDADGLDSRYTPADLYPAMAKCLLQSDYRKAVLISALAGTYTRFDTLRVADPTAHDASVALTLQATSAVSDEQKKTFRTTQQAIVGSPADFAALCKAVTQVGPPAYFPMYMIEHGKTSSSDGEGSVLVPDFDIAQGWQAALTSYLHCVKP